MKKLNKRGKIAVKLSALFGIPLILGGMGNVEAFNRLSGLFLAIVGLGLVSFAVYLYNITHEE